MGVDSVARTAAQWEPSKVVWLAGEWAVYLAKSSAVPTAFETAVMRDSPRVVLSAASKVALMG